MKKSEEYLDPKKLLLVDIEKVKPNKYNPKIKNHKKFKLIKEGIRTKGLIDSVKVREVGDHYEIVDGEQRWTAAYQLGFKKIVIYNYGQLTDQEATERTIWFQQQVPFDKKKEAELVTGLYQEYTELDLPYNELQIKKMEDLTLGIMDSINMGEGFEIIVECSDEEEQEIVFNKLKKEGYKCRVLTF